MVRITIIYDNRTARDDLYPGWGFSALVEKDGTRLLFDAGGDKILLEHNAVALGIDLDKTDYLFLSHEHCDHIGAVSSALHKGLTVVYPASFSSGFKKRIAGLNGIPVEGPIEFQPGLRSTGELGDGVKEQSLIVAGKDGPVLITGCAHPGIVEIARVATGLSGRPLSLVLGGFHLGSKTDSEVEGIGASLRRLGVKRVAPCHCTGERAMRILKDSFGLRYIEAKSGTSIEV